MRRKAAQLAAEKIRVAQAKKQALAKKEAENSAAKEATMDQSAQADIAKPGTSNPKGNSPEMVAKTPAKGKSCLNMPLTGRPARMRLLPTARVSPQRWDSSESASASTSGSVSAGPSAAPPDVAAAAAAAAEARAAAARERAAIRAHRRKLARSWPRQVRGRVVVTPEPQQPAQRQLRSPEPDPAVGPSAPSRCKRMRTARRARRAPRPPQSDSSTESSSVDSAMMDSSGGNTADNSSDN